MKLNKYLPIIFTLIVVIITLLIIGYCYITWNKEHTNTKDNFQDLSTTQPINTTEDITFIYAGYNEIYDYIISSALVNHLNTQQQLVSNNTNDKSNVVAFEFIPRIYIYVTEQSPTQAQLVFTKLKKSDNLIRLYNKQINGRELPDAEINKSIDPVLSLNGDDVRNSITDEQYKSIINMVNKYSFNGINVSFADKLKDIRLYIEYMLTTNPGFLYNVILTDTELESLGITRESVTPPNSGLSITFNPGIEQLVSGNVLSGDNTHFTTLLENRELVPITDDKQMALIMNKDYQNMETRVKEYLFKNKLMATNINMDRIALFKMAVINSYQANIFYILKNNLAGELAELSNKELESKYNKIFTPDLSPEKLAKYAALYKEDPKQKIHYNPDRECFVVINMFQLLRVVLKNKERELNF